MRLIDFIFSEQPLPSEFEDKIKSIKWFIGNESDYIDLETDIAYKTFEEGNTPHFSFNLFATMDLQNKYLYFVFGENLGGGFDDKFEYHYVQGNDMSAEFDKELYELNDDNFKRIVSENSIDISEIKSRMLMLVNYLESSYP
jgi:hypothetical protein